MVRIPKTVDMVASKMVKNSENGSFGRSGRLFELPKRQKIWQTLESFSFYHGESKTFFLKAFIFSISLGNMFKNLVSLELSIKYTPNKFLSFFALFLNFILISLCCLLKELEEALEEERSNAQNADRKMKKLEEQLKEARRNIRELQETVCFLKNRLKSLVKGNKT